jgi:hypothetical protein
MAFRFTANPPLLLFEAKPPAIGDLPFPSPMSGLAK